MPSQTACHQSQWHRNSQVFSTYGAQMHGPQYGAVNAAGFNRGSLEALGVCPKPTSTRFSVAAAACPCRAHILPNSVQPRRWQHNSIWSTAFHLGFAVAVHWCVAVPSHQCGCARSLQPQNQPTVGRGSPILPRRQEFPFCQELIFLLRKL